MYLFTVILKSSIRGILRKRGSLAPLLYGLLIYVIMLIRFVFMEAPSDPLPLLRRALSILVASASLFLGAWTPSSLRSLEAFLRRFGLSERKIRYLSALFMAIPLVLLLIAFAPFFFVSGKSMTYFPVGLAALAVYASLRAFLPRPTAKKKRTLRFHAPFLANLIRFFCRPWSISLAYPIFAFLALPLSRAMKGEGADNRLALLVGAEFVFSFFANFGVDNSVKAEFLLPYPFGYRRWQSHFHLLSFLFLLPGRIAALIAAFGPEGYHLCLLRLMACGMAFLPFLFDPPFVVAMGTVFPYYAFSMAFLAGFPFGAVVVILLCLPAFLSSRKCYMDTPYLSGGIRGRTHLL